MIVQFNGATIYDPRNLSALASRAAIGRRVPPQQVERLAEAVVLLDPLDDQAALVVAEQDLRAAEHAVELADELRQARHVVRRQRARRRQRRRLPRTVAEHRVAAHAQRGQGDRQGDRDRQQEGAQR